MVKAALPAQPVSSASMYMATLPRGGFSQTWVPAAVERSASKGPAMEVAALQDAWAKKCIVVMAVVGGRNVESERSRSGYGEPSAGAPMAFAKETRGGDEAGQQNKGTDSTRNVTATECWEEIEIATPT